MRYILGDAEKHGIDADLLDDRPAGAPRTSARAE